MTLDLFTGFQPHRLFQSGHAQTIFAAYARSSRYQYAAEQRVVQLDDGDSVVLHDDRPPEWQPGGRVALLIHGLTGCHGSAYLVRTADKLNRQGVRTFRLDLRGNGAAKPISSRPGHAGRSNDARAAVAEIARVCPTSPLAAVGFSLGGNILLKMLGESASMLPPQLDKATAVAPPIDLAHCAQQLEQGIQRLYSRAFTKRLLHLLKERQDLWEEIPQAVEQPPKGLLDFDNRVTALLSGFRDADDYYTQSSSGPLLRHIEIPTAIVTAVDDPLISVEMFQTDLLSDATELCLVEGGGHVGFYAKKSSDPDRWWLDWRIVDWMLCS